MSAFSENVFSENVFSENSFSENAFLEFGLETSSLERVALAGRVPCEKVFLERCCDVEGDVVVG